MDVTETSDQQQTIEKYRSFVTGQLRSGADSNSIVQRVTQMGVDPGEAAHIVQTIQAETGMTHATTGQKLVPTVIPMALLGGVVAALASGIVWGLIVKAINYEIGYMAVGVGMLCGFCVVLFTGGGKGPICQACATLTSILGIVVGKYAAIYFMLQSYIAEKHPELVGKVSFFSAKFLQVGTKMLIDTFHPLDILWVVLAVMAANRITRIR